LPSGSVRFDGAKLDNWRNECQLSAEVFPEGNEYGGGDWRRSHRHPLAALETSTQCLILTGQLPPQHFILSRAEDLEIPILSVDLDTLTTVGIIDRAFGQVRLHEPIKIECIRQMMAEHFDIDRLMGTLGLEAAVTVQ
jgi:hypothetical protein